MGSPSVKPPADAGADDRAIAWLRDHGFIVRLDDLTAVVTCGGCGTTWMIERRTDRRSLVVDGNMGGAGLRVES